MALDKEQWKPVAGLSIDYSGYYEVSNFGRVRSLDRATKSRNNKMRFFKGKVLKDKPGNRKYHVLGLTKNGVQEVTLVHKLVAFAWCGPCPGKYGVKKGCYSIDHIDKNKSNNKASNLRWLLVEENSEQGARKGEEHGSSRLKEKQVIEIRNCDLSLKEISRIHKISYVHAYNIICGAKWKHIPYPNKKDQLVKRGFKSTNNI
jgi:hypothetical protein